MEPERDGRIYFTRTPPGEEPFGKPIKGEMICDPALANAHTALGKESGEWRPQIKIPEEYDVEWAPLPKPKPGVDLDPTGCPPRPSGVNPGGVVVPPGNGWVVDKVPGVEFKNGVDEMIQEQTFYVRAARIDETEVPLPFIGMFMTPIPSGEILSADNAVFRFIVDVLRDGGTVESPAITRHGRFDVYIAPTHDATIVVVEACEFDARELAGRDDICVRFWRDWADPEDTAEYSVYLKDMDGLIGKTVEAGAYFNDYYEDETETASDTVIEYGYWYDD